MHLSTLPFARAFGLWKTGITSDKNKYNERRLGLGEASTADAAKVQAWFTTSKRVGG
jgi:hypothetical protein